MATAGNGSGNATNAGNGDNVPTANPNARVDPTDDNPRGYPPFDMRLVPNYTNNLRLRTATPIALHPCQAIRASKSTRRIYQNWRTIARSPSTTTGSQM